MNMREIALRAGVSSATVSRVINGSPLVQERTANRIRKILDEVNFIPNPSATTLKYGRSKTVGLIVPDICNPFYAEFLGAFEDLLVEIDHELLLTSVESPTKLLKSIRRMLMRQVDGTVLMASEFDTEAVEPLLQRRTPMVTVDRREVKIGCSDVSIDYETGFMQAVIHLRDLGHSHIGFIGGTKGLHTSEVRLAAFRESLGAAGLIYRANLVRTGDYRVTGGEAAIESLIKLKPPPTAIITANDLTAFGAVRGLNRLGYSIPTDISVVGVDDLLLSHILQPPLTTIRIPRRRLAKACIEALNYTKDSVQKLGKEFSVPTELVVRESTMKPNSRSQWRKGRRGVPLCGREV